MKAGQLLMLCLTKSENKNKDICTTVTAGLMDKMVGK